MCFLLRAIFWTLGRSILMHFVEPGGDPNLAKMQYLGGLGILRPSTLRGHVWAWPQVHRKWSGIREKCRFVVVNFMIFRMYLGTPFGVARGVLESTQDLVGTETLVEPSIRRCAYHLAIVVPFLSGKQHKSSNKQLKTGILFLSRYLFLSTQQLFIPF